ncbi:hypothetical protein V6N12_021151 [Hibiscus sabdariffa]|uniref:Uncharacterized protein n=1 Tax=Hibiscus sabdariffa TaxID=183260 RepID=A0ABR2AS76_9ROSI
MDEVSNGDVGGRIWMVLGGVVEQCWEEEGGRLLLDGDGGTVMVVWAVSQGVLDGGLKWRLGLGSCGGWFGDLRMNVKMVG